VKWLGVHEYQSPYTCRASKEMQRARWLIIYRYVLIYVWISLLEISTNAILNASMLTVGVHEHKSLPTRAEPKMKCDECGNLSNKHVVSGIAESLCSVHSCVMHVELAWL